MEDRLRTAKRIPVGLEQTAPSQLPEASPQERNNTYAESSGHGRSTHPPVLRRRTAGESGAALPDHCREDAQAHAPGKICAQKEERAPQNNECRGSRHSLKSGHKKRFSRSCTHGCIDRDAFVYTNGAVYFNTSR